ncbi:hypothetical protein FA15DRAFT_550350, partial [Coprinopsis marcescibilis]
LSRETKEKLYARAVTLYEQEQEMPTPNKKKGLRTICKIVTQEYRAEVKKPNLDIALNHNTLRNLVNGSTTIQDFNATTKHWLTKEEEQEVINTVILFALWGQPFSYARLKEQVDAILRARLGKKFPPGGIGDCWAHRFVGRNSETLRLYRSRSLDT